MQILLLRHGETPGNREKRFIGCGTDESLTSLSAEQLSNVNISADICFASPMKRTLETAEKVYDGEIVKMENLKECDFGFLEGKNHKELSGKPFYERFLKAGGREPYPGGEHPEKFYERSYTVFLNIFRDAKSRKMDKILIVTHGGVIMGIMSSLYGDKTHIYDFYVDNGCGFVIDTGEEDELSRRTCYRAWKPF